MKTPQEMQSLKNEVQEKLIKIKAKLNKIFKGEFTPEVMKLHAKFDKIKAEFNAVIKIHNDELAKSRGFENGMKDVRKARKEANGRILDLVRKGISEGGTHKVSDHVSVTFTGFGKK